MVFAHVWQLQMGAELLPSDVPKVEKVSQPNVYLSGLNMTHLTNNMSVTGLKKRSEYLKIASTTLKCVTPGLILQGRNHTSEEIKSGNLSDLRIGFTVSKKVGNAVARNRVKRRLKSVVREILVTKSPKNLDLVIIGRQNTLNRPFSNLVTDLERAIQKIQTLKSKT